MPDIDLKEAVKIAKAYFADLMAVEDIRQEQVEESTKDAWSCWLVTLSGLIPTAKVPPSGSTEPQRPVSAQPEFERVYRILTVFRHNGKVGSMMVLDRIAMREVRKR
jgi:hypothetical protein